jgi:hypothetical protein
MAQTGTLTIKSTEIHTIPLELISETDGTTVTIPAGDTFTASSASPAISATITGDSLVVNALTLPSANTASMVVTVTDSDGDVAYTLTVNYPVPVVDDIAANLTADVVTAQPAPTAPGP